jgi:hypothetical protein
MNLAERLCGVAGVGDRQLFWADLGATQAMEMHTQRRQADEWQVYFSAPWANVEA